MTDPGRRPVTGRPVLDLHPDCAGCARVATARKQEHPLFVAELRESLLFLHEDQRYTGHSVLFLKYHGEHLHALPVDAQMRLWADVAAAARVVQELHRPKRLNYECLGNVLAHIHWHVVPRYDWDPDPKNVIWVRPAAERATGCDPAAAATLIAKMRATLAAQASK